ncbi:MAG: NUDIX domain-containing protein [Aeromicrobium sp.]|uniref:NUDIX hydrolase n=1 Tax=Aeromicrobium sp. TaxID=1871063 RepID=UPI0039E6CE71
MRDADPQGDGQMGEVFAVAVDLVILTIRDERLHVLTVERALAPFAGTWALPGGFVRTGEGLEQAALRELAEETGVDAEGVHVEQLASFGDPGRDPRGRVLSVAYLALAADLPEPQAGTDAARARWTEVDRLPAPPAFDHDRILAAGLERARAKLEYSALATAFCSPAFTIAELRRVYEAVWGTRLDPRNFHRKVTKTPGFVTSTEQTTTRDGGRPARLYRPGDRSILHPPLLRSAGP